MSALPAGPALLRAPVRRVCGAQGLSYLTQGRLPRRKLRGSAHSMPSSARHCTRV